MQADFKAQKTPVNETDPAYIEYINLKAKEEQMMQMYEHSLEPC